MTKQESFKERIRSRMEKTGERYNAARRVLIEQSNRRQSSRRNWVAEPEHSEETIKANTGRGWDEWTKLLDAWSGESKGHTAIATHLREEYGVDGWWSQSVTLGYERIKGLRLKYQGLDGTFTANKSKTIRADATAVREMLVSEKDRNDLFPGFETELRSRKDANTLRIGIGGGVALIYLEPLVDGRAKVTIAHEKLESTEDVELWKKYWSEWLTALELS
ncbi:MAG TPA: hypothetical protein VJ930_11255 [Acidimicrobiia bacterium]|nr:hypothetical protein [Acidimicrobiia bacterium]